MNLKALGLVGIVGIGSGVIVAAMSRGQDAPLDPRMQWSDYLGQSEEQNDQLERIIGVLEDIRLGEAVYVDEFGGSSADGLEFVISKVEDPETYIVVRRLAIAMMCRLIHDGTVAPGLSDAMSGALIAIMLNDDDEPRARWAARKLAADYELQNLPGMLTAMGEVDADPDIVAWQATVFAEANNPDTPTD